MISKFFIERPVLANVLAIVMMLLGGVGLFSLPVAEYPDVVPPTVQVTTRYPGASARTVIDTVALPVEQQVNGVENMLYMQSTAASDGTYTLTVTFAIGTDLNFAQVLVQNRVSAALAALPQAVQAQGLTVQKKSTAILEMATLTSTDPRHDSLFLANYATINLHDELARLPGVGNVTVFGAGQYAMRVWLDPDRLQARGLSASDVVSAIQQQSQEVTAGQVGAPPVPTGQAFQYTLDIKGRLDDPAQFENIILKTGPSASGVQVTRLRDVGRVELGAQTYSQSFTADGRPAAGIAIFQTPEANALDVARRVQAKLDELARAFPPGMQVTIPFNTTKFVSASIDEVYMTLIEAGLLVLLVIMVFLQDWRATLVPATTVPVTILGAFAAMAALGFSVNLSTLFAIVLAIGIVVDDAIVVVEGAARHIEAGLPGREAATKAMTELFGPIIGITLVLMAVFLPSAFLPGLTGRLYAQFALVIAATALISAVNAATLKPTQCALWLRPPVPPERRNLFYRGFNRVYDALERAYAALIGRMVRRSLAMVLAAFVLMGVGFYGFARLPTGFLPVEDQGYLLVGVQLPDGAALARTEAVLRQVQQIAHAVPGVDQVISIAGISVLDNNATLANGGLAYVVLKDWSVRGEKQGLRAVYAQLSQGLQAVDEAATFILVPPAIQGIGNASGLTLQLELRDGSFDLGKLQGLTRTVIANAQTQSGLTHLASPFRAGVPHLEIEVDRVKAESLHVPVGSVFQTLATYVGSSFVDQFTRFGRSFQVYAQADSTFRLRPADIERLSVRNEAGEMIPLGTLVHIRPSVGPALISLYNLYPSSTIIGSPAPGFSTGEAMALMEQVATASLPRGAGFEWTAMSYQEKAVGSSILYAFGLSILLVYLVLAGQYESWLAPVSVILAVPLTLLGPVSVLSVLGLDNNLYTQIGLMLLIALAAKNAILIVEVARHARLVEGKPILDAAVEGARTRLRPILMTSFAFILGVLPLVLATGAGANARISIGLASCSGMLASTCLAVLLVPSFFVVMQRLEERRRAGK
ncbi:Efflux pump membrane transporter BepG [Rhodovastum atsumiense]|uniref:Efflux pump membrane transporter n=1 Tax=Rhodovastum atsumiense TaxID=504468 RepID=A0A5M6IW87_9PROT|nr:efflux RND transporter permease subunit [Rhodovastum atsumiense]KAA5612590.1 efflux RND transporter permease subunit [Rhodovastum atsumiense]CAH2601313.1 Efflux pump membrane transporter BepG [Rhodovastum atsumiense]